MKRFSLLACLSLPFHFVSAVDIDPPVEAEHSADKPSGSYEEFTGSLLTILDGHVLGPALPLGGSEESPRGWRPMMKEKELLARLDYAFGGLKVEWEGTVEKVRRTGEGQFIQVRLDPGSSKSDTWEIPALAVIRPEPPPEKPVMPWIARRLGPDPSVVWVVMPKEEVTRLARKPRGGKIRLSGRMQYFRRSHQSNPFPRSGGIDVFRGGGDDVRGRVCAVVWIQGEGTSKCGIPVTIRNLGKMVLNLEVSFATDGAQGISSRKLEVNPEESLTVNLPAEKLCIVAGNVREKNLPQKLRMFDKDRKGMNEVLRGEGFVVDSVVVREPQLWIYNPELYETGRGWNRIEIPIAEIREFKSANGLMKKGRVIAVSDDREKTIIQWDDGNKVTYLIKVFSPEDQDYLHSWSLKSGK